MEENKRAGNKIQIISVDAFDVNISESKPGNKKAMSETVTHIIPVIIRPDETIEPIDFLSFCPEQYDTFLDSTTGIPLETKVISTAKILIATWYYPSKVLPRFRDRYILSKKPKALVDTEKNVTQNIALINLLFIIQDI